MVNYLRYALTKEFVIFQRLYIFDARYHIYLSFTKATIIHAYPNFWEKFIPTIQKPQQIGLKIYSDDGKTSADFLERADFTPNFRIFAECHRVFLMPHFVSLLRLLQAGIRVMRTFPPPQLLPWRDAN